MLAIEKALPASVISISTALIFPVLLVILLWPLGLTGIWLNFAGTALLAAVLSAVILMRARKELMRPDGGELKQTGVPQKCSYASRKTFLRHPRLSVL